MAGRTHLFLAMSNFAFGEVVLSLRLAWELHARGDRVIFLAPSGQSVLLKGTPFLHGHTDAVWGVIPTVVPTVVKDKKCDTVVIVDAASLYLALGLLRVDGAFLRALDVPVIAFDVWNLPETNLGWDTGTEVWRLPAEAMGFERRLCPVPFIRPEPAPGRYNALPSAAPGPDRAAARAELGLGTGDPMVLVTTASWQTRQGAMSPYHLHLSEAVPPLLFALLAELPREVRVLHVGPETLAADAAPLGDRYRWLARVAPERMRGLVAAADLCVTLNASATTISSAIAAGLPVLLAVNSHAGATADELAAGLPAPPSPTLRAALARLAPLRPFRVWPLGLHDFLEPVLRDNPYTSAITTVELLDEEAFVSSCRRLLGDPDVREDALASMAAYRRLVGELPPAVDVFSSYL